MRSRQFLAGMIVGLCALCSVAQTPLSTAISFQGKLLNADAPANGPHDSCFRMFDASNGGAQIGQAICLDGVNVYNGLFSSPLKNHHFSTPR